MGMEMLANKIFTVSKYDFIDYISITMEKSYRYHLN